LAMDRDTDYGSVGTREIEGEREREMMASMRVQVGRKSDASNASDASSAKAAPSSTYGSVDEGTAGVARGSRPAPQPLSIYAETDRGVASSLESEMQAAYSMYGLDGPTPTGDTRGTLDTLDPLGDADMPVSVPSMDGLNALMQPMVNQ
ncbi:hypothetical protein KIPB_015808, partial [Kipferlia bialata]